MITLKAVNKTLKNLRKSELPRKQLRLVQAGSELHRDELMADWELARLAPHASPLAFSSPFESIFPLTN